MTNFFQRLATPRPYRTDILLFSSIVLLVVLGLNFLLSASSFIAQKEFEGDIYHYIRRQSLFAIVGLTAMVILTQINYKAWKKLAWPVYMVSIILISVILIPGVSTAKSTKAVDRWIQIGSFSIQPSGFAKFATVLLIARLFDRKEKINYSNAFILLVVILLPAALIAKEDLGTGIHLAAASFTLLFLTDFPLRILMSMGIAAIPLLYLNIIMRPYRLKRIIAWIKSILNPGDVGNKYAAGYQISRAIECFASGDWFGTGLGQSLNRHGLPARHTDFILAVIAQDTGIIGISFVFILFCFISFYGLYKMSLLEDNFARVLGSGIILLFFTQFLINVTVTMGLIPVTGLTLPLISYGGTSLVTYLVGFGIVLNITRVAE